VQRQLTSGPRGWPAGPTLLPLAGLLHGDTLQEVVRGIPSRRSVEAKLHGWPTTWLGRLATTWRVTSVTKSVTPNLDPHKYPPTGGNQSYTHYL
jgi:hypothetical protein